MLLRMLGGGVVVSHPLGKRRGKRHKLAWLSPSSYGSRWHPQQPMVSRACPTTSYSPSRCLWPRLSFSSRWWVKLREARANTYLVYVKWNKNEQLVGAWQPAGGSWTSVGDWWWLQKRSWNALEAIVVVCFPLVYGRGGTASALIGHPRCWVFLIVAAVSSLITGSM